MSHYAGKNTVLVAGFAQVPKGTTLYEVYTMVGCVLIIDVDEQVVCDAGFTFVMEKTSEYLADLIRGKSIAGGLCEVNKAITEHFLAPGQGAVLQAIRAAMDRYYESRKER